MTRMASDLKQYFARLNHTHSASDITSGTLDAGRIPSLDASKIGSGTLGTARGGTGITSNPSMLTNLGSTSSANVFQSSPRPGVTGTLAVANGGTGGSTAALARTNLGVPSATDLANIESSIAPVESTTAKTNHAVGDYFMLGDVLMRATAAIATGEQITTSNATPATVQGQIDTLRDSLSYEDFSNKVRVVLGSYEVVVLYRSCGTCFLSMVCLGSVYMAYGWNIVANIDAPYRPNAIIRGFGMAPFDRVVETRVEPNGDVKIHPLSTGSFDIRLHIAYPINVSAL